MHLYTETGQVNKALVVIKRMKKIYSIGTGVFDANRDPHTDPARDQCD